MALSRTSRRRLGEALTACATAAVLTAVALPAYAAPPSGRVLAAGSPAAVNSSYIVTLKTGAGGVAASSGAGRKLVRSYGARIRHTYGTALNGYAIRADADRARRLAADPVVASVTQDTEVTLKHDEPDLGSRTSNRSRPTNRAHQPNTPARGPDQTDQPNQSSRAPDQARQPAPPSWGLDRIDQADRPLDGSYTAPASAGRGTTVYVLDTGIRTTHRDFGGRAVSGWDFVGNDAVAEDANGHGTHVAATVAGTRYGVAKRAEVVGVRVLDARGTGTTAQAIAGIDWVTAHARKPAVANLSIGGFANPQLDAAVRNSIASGVTYTIAAGNNGAPADLSSPARVEEAITVGATDAGDRRARFSNWGPAVDLFAPGAAIVSAGHTSDTASATLSGTSMAAPHAAGAAALYLADHPSARPAEVGDALVRASTPGRVGGAGPLTSDKLLRVGS
ncbi:S8 family peptidase [Streptomyces sp. NPDC050617]|uniref:S8 family peptidase n=1 Tax=Streptomyces sp. NPDC050617 TaxID=3154628 RepID=UPI00344A576D